MAAVKLRATAARMLLAAAAALLLAAAWMPRADAAVAAIDLGTEWMKVSLVKPGVPMEIVLNRESKRKTATAVAIRNSERHYGDDAINMFTRFPRDSYTRLLDLLGRYFNDSLVEDYRNRLPNVMEADERGGVAFRGDGDRQWFIEELVSMLLSHARDQAVEMGGVPIVDVVVTVPPYFNQFERQAILDAAELVGLNVLQLINVDTAVALHFGITRKFDSPEHYIFYDMGAGSTKASLVTYSTVETTKGKSKSSVAQYEVRAVAFDRSLGGHAFDLRLRQQLATLFAKQKGVKTDVFKNERAMAKLLKESTRVKQILSANQEAFGRVEQLLDDVDLNVRITRQEFEELCADLFERVPGPLLQVSALAGIPLDNVTAVVLMGGGLRIPNVQAVLKTAVGRDLSQNINSDEAAALGAAFKAAELSRQFKVKEVKLIDVQPYQINVRFQGAGAPSTQESVDTAAETDSGSDATAAGEEAVDGITERVLFPAWSPLNKRKQVSFLREAPFSFDVLYAAADGAALATTQGPLHIATVEVDGFDTEQIADYIKRTTKPTKVSVVLQLDANGMVQVQKAEAIFEVLETQPAAKKPTLMENIYDFLGMGKDKDKDTEGGDSTGDDHAEGSDTESESADSDKAKAGDAEGKPAAEPETASQTDKAQAETAAASAEGDASAGASASAGGIAEEEEQLVTKTVTKRVKLRTTWKPVGFQTVTKDQKAAARERTAELNQVETDKREHSEAFNGLEALLYKSGAFLESSSAAKFASSAELAALKTDLEAAKSWFDEVGEGAETAEYKEKAKPIRDLLELVDARKEEERTRPEAIDTLRNLIAVARKAALNVTKLVKDGDPNPWYTTEDVQKFLKSINETDDWLEAGEKTQESKAAYDEPALTVRNLERRARQVEKEVLALLKKPKPKPTKKAEPTTADKTDKDTKTKTKSQDSDAEKEKASEEGNAHDDGGAEDRDQADEPAKDAEDGSSTAGEEPAAKDAGGDQSGESKDEL